MISEITISQSLLRSFVPLSNLTPAQLDWLLLQSTQEYFYAGQVLQRAGEEKQERLYLVHGTVREIRQEQEKIITAQSAQAVWPLAHLFSQQCAVIAEDDCSVLKVPTQLLEQLLCWSQVARCLLAEIAVQADYQNDYFWIKKLLESRLFYKVPPVNIKKILSKFRPHDVSAGTKVVSENEEGSKCYLIKKGSAQVIKEGKILATLQAGDIFGEDALMHNQPRNATVEMLEESSLLSLDKDEFYQLLIQPAVTMIAVSSVPGFIQSGVQMLDVRTQEEFDLGHFSGAINLPLNLSRLKSCLLDKQSLYIAYSATEERAKASAFLLSEQGYQVYALQSGMNALPQNIAEQFVSV